ncbi:hypothetical protein [Clostridium akagii]|uniref:hypothetical protein n=1 Tax=Clostridium akagii TaxID=91623 RepID=UPI000B0DB40B
MSLVAEATYNAFKPDKLNYELLGQGEGIYIHWHLFLRCAADTPNPGPVWKLLKEEMYSEKYIPSDEELEEMKKSLKTELKKLL